MTKEEALQKELISELMLTIYMLTEKSDLLAIVGSYGDTQSAKDTLADLKAWTKNNE